MEAAKQRPHGSQLRSGMERRNAQNVRWSPHFSRKCPQAEIRALHSMRTSLAHVEIGVRTSSSELCLWHNEQVACHAVSALHPTSILGYPASDC